MKTISGEQAWAGLAVGIVAYEIAAKENQLLSEAVDRALVTHPLATRLGVAYVAIHLLNLIPPNYDPLHHVALIGCRIRLGRRHR